MIGLAGLSSAWTKRFCRVVWLTSMTSGRVFTLGQFDRGGRLFGGWWQGLKNKQRLDGVLIEGEPVAELDYGRALRMLYGRCGCIPPEGDLYAVKGLEPHRSGIKKLINAALFSEKPLTRMPKGMKQEFEERYRVSEVLNCIAAVHAPVAHHLFKGIGHELQFIESQILISVLLELKQVGIVALPIHDAILVPLSRTEEAREAMITQFLFHVGIESNRDYKVHLEAS